MALGDDVASAMGAAMVVVFVGERPGMSAADSVGATPLPSGSGSAHASWLRTCQSLVRTLVPVRPSREPLAGVTRLGPARLRVEVDGVTLVDLDQPVEGVSVTPGASGFAEVEVRPVSVGASASALCARGRTVTVSGADFRYRADAVVAGPVRTRTWVVREGAWGLTLPAVG